MKLKLFVHPLYFFLGAALIVLGQGFTFLAYTITIVVHEMGHAGMAEKLGFVMDDIRIMPYGAAVGGALEGLKPVDEIKIALAGPLVNLITAVIFTALWWLVPESYFFTEAFVTANLVNAVTNLLPVYPLDGGRVLSALIKLKKPRVRAQRVVRISGMALSAILFGGFTASIFFGFNVTLGTMAAFIFFSSMFRYGGDGYMRIYERNFRARHVGKGLEVKELIVNGDIRLYEAVRLITPAYYYRFVIVDEKLRRLSAVTETELEELVERNDIRRALAECKIQKTE
ncbi:MAG: site-2 protease family protein [Clostridiales bacterium]|nr:site-2 protease family protein [Clostridiales bacterium]